MFTFNHFHVLNFFSKIYFELTNDKSNNVVYAVILPSSFLTLVGFDQGEGDSD
jgi:hypothetical protein